MTAGSCAAVNWRQNGHWRSAYSVRVTFALALPSVVPRCGMPENRPADWVAVLGLAVFASWPWLTRIAARTRTPAPSSAVASSLRRRALAALVTGLALGGLARLAGGLLGLDAGTHGTHDIGGA